MSIASGLLSEGADPTPPPVRGLRRASTGIILALALTSALAFYGLILPLNAASQAAVNWVEHTHKVIEATDQILITVDNTETGQRGFLLTHDNTYLNPYNEGIKAIWHQYFAIRDLTVDNPRQQSNLQGLAELLQSKMSELEHTIILANNNSYDSALNIVRGGEGQRLMEKIRQATAEISSQEQRLLQARQAQQQRLQQHLTLAFIALAILSVIGLLLGGVLLAWIFTAKATRQRVAAESIEHQRLLDMVNVAAVLMREVDGTIRFWSEGCQRLYGYTSQEAIGRSSHELLQTVFPVSLADTDAALLRGGAWNGELRHRTRDGAQVIVSASKALHDYADGSGRLVVETLTDVTALRQAEEELQKSEAEAAIERQRLLDMVNVAAVMMREVDGTIRFWSEGCHRLYGYTAKQAIGQSSHELLRTVFPVSLADTDATLLRRGAWNGELRHRARDGEEVIVSASKTLHDYADGSGRLVVETLTDVTELRQAQAELQTREAMFRGIFDSQFQFIKLLTPDGIVLEANRTALNAGGLIRSDVVGRPIWETGWWPAAERSQLRNEVVQARQGATVHREVEIIGAGGKTIWIDFSLTPKRDPVTGTVQWLIAEGRDLTDKRSLTAQLAQAQKVQALGQLAGGIAHDFNNILQAVLGAAALIGQSRGVDDRARHLANTAIAAANRGMSITQRLLSFARRGELRAEPIDTAEKLSNMREVLAHTLGTVISVRADIPPDLPALIADPAQLDTAIINLGTNARDAMPDGGTLILSAKAERVTDGEYHPAGLAPGAYVRLSVIDDGIGMDAATLARASEPFFTTKPQGKGTGLGVSMVKGFAEQSGGGLTITSAPNAGTMV